MDQGATLYATGRFRGQTATLHTRRLGSRWKPRVAWRCSPPGPRSRWPSAALTSFRFGGREFGRQDAFFSAAEPGAALTDAFTAGIIGIPVLRAFRLVFDYPNRQVSIAG